MARAFSEIAFTKTVRALQSIMGSRESYAAFDITPDRRDRQPCRDHLDGCPPT